MPDSTKKGNQTSMMKSISIAAILGYYGRLLSFEERHQLLSTLHDLSMDSYLYAPKEDVFHRFDWRQPCLRTGVLTLLRLCGCAVKTYGFWQALPQV